MKRKIRIIPFLISLLIVLGSVIGIAIYSYNWKTNRDRYLEKIFDIENKNGESTNATIDSAMKWTSSYYQFNPGTLTYRDSESKKEYGETPFTNIYDGNINNYFKNGVLHIEGWFDVIVYSVVNLTEYTNEETGEQESEYTLNYYFMFENINYAATKGFNPANIGIAFVEGIGEGIVDENDEDAKEFGDAALETYLENIESGESTSTNAYFYTYSGSAITYRIIDKNAQNAGDGIVSYLYKIMPFSGETNKVNFNELEEITFALIYSDENNKITNLVEGTLTNLPKIEDYLEGRTGLEGYASNYNKAPYINFIWPRMLLHSSIALLLSGIVAVLFYLIWDTDEPQKPQNTRYKKKVVKSKK